MVTCSGLLDAASAERLPKSGLPRANKKLAHFLSEFFMRRVVEAAGVEPASGSFQPRGPTCLFRDIFLPQSPHGQGDWGMSPTVSLP